MTERTKAFLTAMAVGAVLSLAIFFMAQTPESGIVRRLCDSFFVSGVLIAGSGGLFFARNEGMFDIFGFGVKSLFGIRLFWHPQDDQKESYAEYKQRKREKRKSPAMTLLAGAVYLLLSLVMLAVYFLLA